MFFIDDRSAEKHELEAWPIIKIGFFRALWHVWKGRGRYNPVMIRDHFMIGYPTDDYDGKVYDAYRSSEFFHQLNKLLYGEYKPEWERDDSRGGKAWKN